MECSKNSIIQKRKFYIKDHPVSVFFLSQGDQTHTYIFLLSS